MSQYQTQTQSSSSAEARDRGFRQRIFIYIAALLAIIGGYDDITNIYERWKNPEIGSANVQEALRQQALTEKNLECLVTTPAKEFELNETVKMRALACGVSDIQITVYAQNKPAKQSWITVNETAAAKAALWNSLTGPAFAQTGIPINAGAVTLAQAQIQSVCQAWEDEARKAKLIRITNENGKCFKEIVNVFTGRIEYREESPCNAQCVRS